MKSNEKIAQNKLEGAFNSQESVWNLKEGGGKNLFEKKKDIFDFCIQSAENLRCGRIVVIFGLGKATNIFKDRGFYDYKYIEKEEELLMLLERERAYVIFSSDITFEERIQNLGLKEYQDYFVLSRSAEYVKKILYHPLPAHVEEKPMHIGACSSAEYMPNIFPQLEQLYEILPNRKINFYVFHSRKAQWSFDELKANSKVFPNINVVSVVPEDEDIYEKIRITICPWSKWPTNTLYWICAHKYLPAEVDRFLRIDAGDIMFDDNFDAFYYDDFQDNALISTMTVPTQYREIDSNGRFVKFSSQDLWSGNPLYVGKILHGTINPGVTLVNLDYMREHGYTEQTYLDFGNKLIQHYPQGNIWLDQGLMSAFFVDKTKFYGLDTLQDGWFRPFQFVFVFDEFEDFKPYYHPIIIHFCGLNTVKPWETEYANAFLPQNKEARARVATYRGIKKEYYEKWFGYYIRSQLRLNATGYLERCNKQYIASLDLRNKLFLELVEVKIRSLYKVPIDIVNGGFYLHIPISASGGLHYEIWCQWGHPAVCLHFENEFYKHNKKTHIIEQAVMCDKRDPLNVSLKGDHLGCGYLMPAYDAKMTLLYLRRLINITLPILRQTEIIGEEYFLSLQ